MMQSADQSTAESFDEHAYRLSRCAGFRVDAPEGWFGVVEDVMFRVRPDTPDALIVRTARDHRLAVVPVEDVDEVLVDVHCVVLARTPETAGGDFVSQVRSRLGRLADEQRRRGRRLTVHSG